MIGTTTPSGSEAAGIAAFGVSRETTERLRLFVALLKHWQTRTNLVAPSTLAEVWRRHVADSLQFLPLAPDARHWVDLGSGGGFPGVVIAIGLRERSGGRATLIESNAKKAAFLRTAARELALPMEVRAARIEDCGDAFAEADAVSARALASLDRLCGLVAGRLAPQVPCFFAKGRNHDEEIVDARRGWRFNLVKHASLVEDGAAILELRDVARRSPQ